MKTQPFSLSEISALLKTRIDWHLQKTNDYKAGRNNQYHKYMFKKLTSAVHDIENASMALPSDFAQADKAK